ncbi:MAG: glycosyltransferase family 2 protein, partial [Burkholderiaceae bacterium]|nr:glycosyltransferase family 2 protein [Burkholderiaceae bacterium]
MASWDTTPPGQRITLCMIVRDEEAILGQCLSSASRWVDEIVVVDTGSCDGTIAIAESYGARVGHFAWCDDFAKARNASLSLATGEWVLCLDADETLEPSRAQFIRELVAEGRGPDNRPRAYTMVVRSETAHGVTDDLQIRLWQHGAGLEFAGRIHESLVAPTGSTIGVMPTDSVLVTHTGYKPAIMEVRDKVRRNGAMLDAAIAADPDDAYLFYKHAQHLVTDADYAGAVGSAERALELSASGHASRGALGGSNLADTYRTLIAAHLALSHVSAAV